MVLKISTLTSGPSVRPRLWDTESMAMARWMAWARFCASFFRKQSGHHDRHGRQGAIDGPYVNTDVRGSVSLLAASATDSSLGNNRGDRGHPSGRPRGPGPVQKEHQFHPPQLGPAVITSHPGIVAQAARVRQAPGQAELHPDLDGAATDVHVWAGESLSVQTLFR